MYLTFGKQQCKRCRTIHDIINNHTGVNSIEAVLNYFKKEHDKSLHDLKIWSAIRRSLETLYQRTPKTKISKLYGQIRRHQSIVENTLSNDQNDMDASSDENADSENATTRELSSIESMDGDTPKKQRGPKRAAAPTEDSAGPVAKQPRVAHGKGRTEAPPVGRAGDREKDKRKVVPVHNQSGKASSEELNEVIPVVPPNKYPKEAQERPKKGAQRVEEQNKETSADGLTKRPREYQGRTRRGVTPDN